MSLSDQISVGDHAITERTVIWEYRKDIFWFILGC